MAAIALSACGGSEPGTTTGASGGTGGSGGAGGASGAADAAVDQSVEAGADGPGIHVPDGGSRADVSTDGRTDDARGGTDGATTADTVVVDTWIADAADGGLRDPLAPQPDLSEGLTNISTDLNALLENGALKDACANWEKDRGNRKLKLLCGKAMYFYEGFGGSGIPKPIITWLISSFPDEVGPGFSKLGMFADPTSTESLPLGLANGKNFGTTTVPTMAFSCPSCHLSKLPDGRYVIGEPNHNYRYGHMNLMATLLPSLLAPPAGDAAVVHDPAAMAVVQPLIDRMDQNPAIRITLLLSVLPLLGSTIPVFTASDEHHYASWRTGTLDFFIAPLSFDDKVHTISKIPTLFGVPGANELTTEGIPSVMITWAGGTLSLTNFARGFVALSGGSLAVWPDSRLEPLLDYLVTLRPPPNLTPPPAASAQKGLEVFNARGCLGCHDGPRGMGRKLYEFADIGTDDALKRYTDPDLTGQPCCGINHEPGDTITHRIKSPRIAGLANSSRFLHNGSLDSLEQLFCLEKRPDMTEIAYGSAGHTYGCDAPEDERRALIDYLRAR